MVARTVADLDGSANVCSKLVVEGLNIEIAASLSRRVMERESIPSSDARPFRLHGKANVLQQRLRSSSRFGVGNLTEECAIGPSIDFLLVPAPMRFLSLVLQIF